MTTSSVSAPIAQITNANFQAWVQEIYTALVTTCGLSQTTDTGQMAVPCATATPVATLTAAGYYIFRFTDTLSLGPLATVNGIVGGSGYTSATYTAVPLTGGTGSGAKATIVVTAGAVSAVTITTAGTGYNACDQLSAAAANLGGAGSGFTAQAATLTSGTPIVFKLEFGSGSVASTPMLWITVGFGTNGAGTITGTAGTTATTRVATLGGGAPSSTTTPYTSRYVYSAALSFLGLVFKIAGTGTTQVAMGGFLLFRTNDGNGTPTSAGVVLIAGATTATPSASGGFMQVLSQANSLVYPTLVATASGNYSGGLAQYNGGNNVLFGLTSTYNAGTVYVFPIFTIDPVIRFSAFVGAILPADVPLNNSFSAALVGATAISMLNVGQPFGGNYVGVNSQYSAQYLAIPWQ